jgi:hypothetical protein
MGSKTHKNKANAPKNMDLGEENKRCTNLIYA